jgi:aryl-alcohol dehydrogenase-like predicted oxidoreductase
MAKDAIGRSLQKMDTNRLDLVQFHWVRRTVLGWVVVSFDLFVGWFVCLVGCSVLFVCLFGMSGSL